METSTTTSQRFLQISLQKKGGGAIDSLEFSNGLVSNNFSHTVIIADGNELSEKFETLPNRMVVRVKTFNSTRRDFFIATFMFGFIRLVSEVYRARPEIIYVTHRHPWMVFVFILNIFLRAKIYSVAHDNPFAPKENDSYIENKLERISLKLSHTIVTHSEFVAKGIRNSLPKKPVEVLALGAYSSMISPRLDVATKPPLCFGFIGRIEKYKGISDFIEAATFLEEQNIPCRFLIAGNGLLSDKEKEMLSMLKNVDTHIRWLSTQELAEYVSQVDVIVLPYQDATQSGVVSIALAAGIPVISTDVGGLPEYIHDGRNGLVVNSGSVKMLVEAMKNLATNHQLCQNMAQQMRLFADEISWEKSVKKIILPAQT